MKIYRCKFCDFNVCYNKADKGIRSAKYIMGHHYDTVHQHAIPEHMDGYRYFYFLLTKKEQGSCVICKEETAFNKIAMKYSRFCGKESCKEAYVKIVDERNLQKYGKVHRLDEEEMQKKMLAGRRISGEYTWSDQSAKFGYTGTYELDFLQFLDQILKWKSCDLMSPSPHSYSYDYDGSSHFYIPDFFIPSLAMEIEIKDDGSAKHISPESRAKDVIKEELMRSASNYFNFVKIINKNYSEFLEIVKEE